jgi:hypothetical protein
VDSSSRATVRPQIRQTGRPPRGEEIAVRTFSSKGAMGCTWVVGEGGGHRYPSAKRADAFARVRRVNAFHVFGGLFALWAVSLSFVGITRENFPPSAAAARVVGAISILLALATIGSAIITSANEDEDEGGGEQALILRI